MNIPKDLKYTKEHEWVVIDSDQIATIGISDFAQNSLGDITFVQLPSDGDEVHKDDAFGLVESVKAVSDLYSPVTGRVVEVNLPLLTAPELLNDDPYNDGWMIKVEVSDLTEIDELMDATEYKEYVEEKS